MTPPYNPDLVMLREAVALIEWMSGSKDFAPEGVAHEGWLKSQDKISQFRDRLASEGYRIF